MSRQIREQIIVQLDHLTDREQERVLEFVRALAPATQEGVPDRELLQIVGLIPRNDLDVMARAIAEDCERVDTGEW